MKFVYIHKRKKPWKETVKRTRSLQYHMNKLIQQQEKVEDQHRIWITCPGKYYERKRVICKVLTQQKQILETGKSVLDRIVSITKSYVRPIVRGKEVKKVEFGAKMNMLQVGGINFIEHLDFDPFNEGARLRNSIWYARMLFGKITHISADEPT